VTLLTVVAVVVGTVAFATGPPASAGATPPCSTSTLAAGQTLASGACLVNGQFETVMQADGNLVTYDNSAATPVWSSGTWGSPGAYAIMQADGNFVIYATGGAGALWATFTGVSAALTPNDTLSLQSDGILQVVSASAQVLWQTGTSASPFTTELTSGQSMSSPSGDYQLIMQSDGNLVLYFDGSGQHTPIWATQTSGNSGDVAVLQSDGNLVVTSAAGAVLWSAGSSAPNPTLVVQEDGNVVVYGTNSAGQYAAWATRTVGDRGATLLAGQTLQPGQFMSSPNNQYRLQMGTGGVLALYSTAPYTCPMWTAPAIASANGYATTPKAGSYMALTTSGDFQLFGPGTSSGPQWAASQTSTWTGGGDTSGDYLSLGNDGNVVLATPGGQTVRWVANTENLRGSVLCTSTDLTQGQYLVPWSPSYTDNGSFPAAVQNQNQNRLIMQPDCNLVLYQYAPPGLNGDGAVWASNTDNGGTGEYQGCYATMQSDGNLVIYAPNYPGGQKALWASATAQSTAPPFNLGAMGPYLSLPIVRNTADPNYYGQSLGLFVTTIHGATL
jgi:hypothetical protein